jgi:hypothetical protein
MPAEKSTAGETWQRNLNRHAEGLMYVSVVSDCRIAEILYGMLDGLTKLIS